MVVQNIPPIIAQEITEEEDKQVIKDSWLLNQFLGRQGVQ